MEDRHLLSFGPVDADGLGKEAQPAAAITSLWAAGEWWRLPSVDGKGVNTVIVSRKRGNVQVLDGKKKVLFSQPLSSLRKLTILGAADKPDKVTVDFAAGGSFVLPEGIVLNGGAGKQVDTLVARGTANQDALASATGSVAINGLGIQLLNVERVTLDGGAGDDTYQVSDLDVKTTISDSKGSDLLDFSQATSGVTVDLGKSRGHRQPVEVATVLCRQLAHKGRAPAGHKAVPFLQRRQAGEKRIDQPQPILPPGQFVPVDIAGHERTTGQPTAVVRACWFDTGGKLMGRLQPEDLPPRADRNPPRARSHAHHTLEVWMSSDLPLVS